ncbi:MAG: signal peptidase I [Spirochaetales bacterium]|nr:signal peptidase I [Spirochaetales bacterium]
MKKRSKLIIIVICVILAVTLGFSINYLKNRRLFTYPGTSMTPTILPNDKIFIDLSCYKKKNPQRGDVILYRPKEFPDRIFINRCIAVENDVVEFIDGFVYLNGKKQVEKYAEGKTFSVLQETDYRQEVQEGHIYVLGDNRKYSNDSRYSGTIPLSSLVGKAISIYDSKTKKNIGKKL